MSGGYELFDHTADMGIRARAETLAGLLRPAAAGLYAVIGVLVAGAPAGRAVVDLTAADPATLLRDFLDELLWRFERDSHIAGHLAVRTFDGCRLHVAVDLHQVDRRKSVYHHEVKAVTYHHLSIRQDAAGFEATVIVDI